MELHRHIIDFILAISNAASKEEIKIMIGETDIRIIQRNQPNGPEHVICGLISSSMKCTGENKEQCKFGCCARKKFPSKGLILKTLMLLDKKKARKLYVAFFLFVHSRDTRG